MGNRIQSPPGLSSQLQICDVGRHVQLNGHCGTSAQALDHFLVLLRALQESVIKESNNGQVQIGLKVVI